MINLTSSDLQVDKDQLKNKINKQVGTQVLWVFKFDSLIQLFLAYGLSLR